MILNNLKNLLKCMTLVGGPTNFTTYDNHVWVNKIGSVVSTINENIDYIDVKLCKNPFMVSSISLGTTNTSMADGVLTVVFGKGTTPVTESDIRVESIISEGLNLKATDSIIRNFKITDGNKLVKKVSISCPVTNGSGNDITVTEVGFQYYCVMYTEGTVKPVLIHREVFEPVTIPHNGMKTFQFEFEITTQFV